MKPPYRVPSMAEVRAVPFNGLTVASTFSGCGGSCTGYRMAGFRVAWANEFVPAAQDSYRANWPDSYLDPRDVRQVKPEEILSRLGMKQGDLDLLDGSPPCQAFSTAGKRHKGWGKEKRYEHVATQKNETLFGEYVRLLRGLMPRVFVAENVSGLVKGVAKGFFIEILKALKGCGYRVEARLLDAEWLGVPQMRQRIIFVGVREDVKAAPTFPKPLPYRYSVRDALGELSITGRTGPHEVRTPSEVNQPMNTIQGSDPAHTRYEVTFMHDEAGAWSEGDVTERPAPTVRSGRAGTMFVASRDRRGAYGKEGEITEQPAPAVPERTAGNLWVSRRKFTIADLKRICAFPDDYVLTGSYAQQWERLGNSVPPVMMYHVATAVREQIMNGKVG